MGNDGDISINLTLEDKNFVVSVKNSGRLLRGLREDLNKAAGGVDSVQKHYTGFNTQLRHTVMSLAAVRFAVMDFYDIFLRLPKHILETSGEIERLTKLMGGLSKATTEAARAQEAAENTKFIFDTAKDAPFSVDALADSFVKLKAGGIDPTNGSMQALIDSVARFGGDSQSLHRASVAIQQMAGKGVISMEELRQQLGEAVPNAIHMMAQGMGMSMSELVKQISRGAVGSEDALKRMFTMMEFYNRGAASEMMDTWTGLNARLKTEWTLLQTEIGKAGFADEVKNQLKDLITLMGSGEGIQMARQLGYELGQVVKAARIFTEALIENWHWIKMVGEALMVYFAATRVTGAIKSLTEHFSVMRRNAKESATLYSAQARQRAQDTASHVANLAAQAQAQAAADAATLAKKQSYYKGLHTRHANHLAEINRLEAANAVARARIVAGAGSAEVALIAARNAQVEALKKKTAAVQATIDKERILQRALADSVSVSQRYSAELTRKASAAASAAANIGILSRAAGVLRMGLAALGGPIGIVTTALMIGIPAWLEWGNSGEKAIQKIRDALNSGTANEDTIGAITKQLNEKRKELSELDNKSQWSILPKTADDIQKQVAERKRIVSEIAELEQGLIDARAQKIKNAGENAARAQRDVFQKESDQLAKEYRARSAKIIEAGKQRLDQVKKGSAEEIKIEREMNLAIRQNAEEFAKEDYRLALEHHKKAAKVLTDAKLGGNEGNIAAAQGIYDKLTQTLEEKARFSENASHLLENPQFGVKKEKKPDPLQQALEKARGDLEGAKIQMDDLLDGSITFGRLRDAAYAELMGDRAAGMFNVKDERGNSVKPSEKDPRLGELADTRAQKNQIDRERQVQKSLTSLLAQSAQERQNALERFGNSEYYEAESTGVRRLERQLAKLKETLVDGTPEFINFKKNSEKIISDQAVADLVNFAAGFKKASADLEVSLQTTDLGKKKKAFEIEKAMLESQLEQRKKAITDNASLTSEEVKRAIAEVEEHFRKLGLSQERALRTPLQELAEQWEDITKRMRDASVRWSNDTIDAFVMLAKTGKFEWRSLVDTILTDIMRMSLQKGIGGLLNSAIDKGVNMVAGIFGADTSTTMGGDNLPIDPATGAVLVQDASNAAKMIRDGLKSGKVFDDTKEELESVWTKVGTGFKGVWDGMGTMLSNLGGGLMSLMSGLSSGLGSFMSAIAGGGNGGMLGQVLGMVGQLAVSAIGGMSAGAAGVGGAASYTGYGGMGSPTMMKFAEGGIMTEFGPLPLKKYLNGGIANSPQVALYGEGKKPEAYVPLPDGRTIPVTMTGGGGSNVSIAITVNSDGSENNNSNGNDASAWNGMAKKIKGVVQEEIMIQKRPGGALYRT